MKIRCIANTGADLPDRYFLPHLFYQKETQFQLTLGKEYIVYALYEWQGNVWYYICDDRYTYYPIHNPAPLFEVVDSRLSKYWRFALAPHGLLTVAVEPWISDSYFYDKLTDGKEEEVLIFEKYKETIDAEALSSEAVKAAIEVCGEIDDYLSFVNRSIVLGEGISSPNS